MGKRGLSQISFFDPEFLVPNCLKPGTVPWLLARYRSKLFPDWLFKGWRGEGLRGRKAWPAVVLLSLMVLRWTEEGISRLGSCRRAITDLLWRAALGLQLGSATPTEKTIREFESFLSSRHADCGTPRILLFHEHVVRLCIDEGVVQNAPVWAMDSTPMWCYGAVLDTFRLLGDGLTRLGRIWAEATRSSLAKVSQQWAVPHLLAPSSKGAFDVDWSNKGARNKAISALAEVVLKRVEFVRQHIGSTRRGKRKRLLKSCRCLLRVLGDNLETDGSGSLVIARRVAKDRLISLTDPEARHGRKSKSQTFNGFKLHLLGDVVSGLILSLTVTAGNKYDGHFAHRLLRRARKLNEQLDMVMGDTAYGSAELRQLASRELGVTILSRPAPQPKMSKLGRGDFAIDFENWIVTCPNGISSSEYRFVNFTKGLPRTRQFYWPKQECQTCPLSRQCPAKSRRALKLHPYEKELRASREAWKDPRVREKYRIRSQCERLVNQAIRHGARRARSFGVQAANRQGLHDRGQHEPSALGQKAGAK